jgi:putative ABC transport system permease protein
MFIGESLRTTLTEIWAHKMRSLLTLFGVVLGTMAVVTMVSLIEAVKVEIWNGIDSLGLRGVLFVSAETPTSNLDVKRSHLSEGLRREDAAGLVEASDQITSAAPVSFTQQVIAWGDASQSIRITATTPQYAVVFDRRAEKGRYISDLDLKRKSRVVVIGHFLAEELFGGHDVVGQWVRIGDHRFEVVGIGERVGNDFINDGWSRREMEGATIPLTTMQSLYGGGDRVPLLMVKAADTNNLSQLFAHLKNRLWRQHNRVEDFEIENVAQEILEAEGQIDEQLRGWTIVLFAISAISLVVGGVSLRDWPPQVHRRRRPGHPDPIPGRGDLPVGDRGGHRFLRRGGVMCRCWPVLRGRSADIGLCRLPGDRLRHQHRARRGDLSVTPRGPAHPR